MILRGGFAQVALKLQEAAELSNGDVRTRLSDAINDAHRGTGKWAYYVDHFGDGESGDVILSCDGDIKRCPYSISGGDSSAAKCMIDFSAPEDVVPRTMYEPEADEDDHYAAMEESLKAEGVYTGLPLYERFIAKSERDSASSDDFAGKGKSFPILKPEDVSAAAHALGRAGSKNLSTNAIKARIIAIAKRKGWTKQLPKAWQGGDSTGKESAGFQSNDGLRLVESAATVEAIVLREARADYEIKLIAPGKGSSAFYPKEVLKRDGPKVFKAGTHVYLNHPTAAEESARPEGDVKNLAGVLSTDAVYHESHPKGPGLFARMKVFADHAATVEEKAPHVGMSIRAGGVAEANRKQDGLPILKELTHAESVDVVTRAGAGGMILTEAAKSANPQIHQEAEMTADEITKLVEAGVAKATAPLRDRAIKGDALIAANRTLKTIALPEASKQRVVDTVLREALPLTEAGELDTAKFSEAVNSAAKSEAEYVASLTGAGRVFGMGAGAALAERIDPKEAERRETAGKLALQESENVFTALMGGNAAAGKAAALKGVAA